jgi:Cys-rich four helix bundle protein (predicted Tat secretion target)
MSSESKQEIHKSTAARAGSVPDLSTSGLSRRALLSGAGALGAALISGASLAADQPGHSHEHHAPRNPALLDAAGDCADKGKQCLAHCLVAFQEGDTTLADCARKVNEMISICDALSIQVASNSPYVEPLAKVCRQACADCEKACRKHEDTHLECKNCAVACAQIVAAIDAM